jgi:peptide/nickel transport system permease protein
MVFFIARRLLYLVPVLIAVSLLTFSIASLLPGDLAYVILGDQATPEKVAALRADMGLDQPILWHYLGWLGHVLQGDFGQVYCVALRATFDWKIANASRSAWRAR